MYPKAFPDETMSQAPLAMTPLSLAPLIEGIAKQGYAVVPDFLAPARVAELRAACLAAWERAEFRPAGVGRGTGLGVRQEIRSDQVLWLEGSGQAPVPSWLWEDLETLRLGVNRALWLGLVDFEGHFAVYPPGASYGRHLDRFRDSDLRTLTLVLYLNADWSPGDGGELRIYLEGEVAPAPYLEVQPLGGTLVAFLSGEFFHEVLPARRQRLALTGWFKRCG